MSENYNDKNIKKMLESENVPEELNPQSIKIMIDKFSGERKRKIKIKRTAMKVLPIAASLVVAIGAGSRFWLGDVHHDCLGDKGTYKCDVTESAADSELSVDSMEYAVDYTAVYDYFKRAEKKSSQNDTKGAVWFDTAEADAAADEAIMEDSITGDGTGYTSVSSEQETNDYSDTYNQEEGVIEADIVKTDGNNIYYAYGGTIKYAQVKDGEFLKTNSFFDIDGEVNDMYLYNNMLVIIYNVYDEDVYGDVTDGGVEDRIYTFNGGYNTCISFYSAGDNPQLIGSFTQEGYYNDVRMTSDGYLYLISNFSKYYSSEEYSAEDYERFIPSYTVNQTQKYIEPDCIMIPDYCPDDLYSECAYTNIAAFDMNTAAPYEPSDIKSIAGSSGTIYCSAENLYITYGYEDTEITRFAIKNGTVSAQASGNVSGYVNDQFSMSEYNGYLRIATTIDAWNNSWNGIFGDSQDYNNCLYVLDMELNEVGKVKDFGIDETIKSVNFQGDTAYIVTFRQTDPLYAIDLSNPENPIVLDEFKINGYSTYMQKWSDDLLIGFGQNADESGVVTGIKLTMFDNSDAENLSALDTVEINFDWYNEYIYSEAIGERKALLINPEKNIIGFPVTEEHYPQDSYENVDYKSYYIFYSFTDGKLNCLNKIYSDIDYISFNRSIIIGDYIYVLSDKQFKSADIETFTNIQSVIFD